MATRCLVGVDDGKDVIASWVACDGYIEGVGQNLIENYNDAASALVIAKHGTFTALDNIHEKPNPNSLPLNMPSDVFLENTIPDLMAEYIYLWDVEQACWFVYKGKAYSHRDTEYIMELKYPMSLSEVIRHSEKGPFVYIVKRTDRATGKSYLANKCFVHRQDAVKFCKEFSSYKTAELPLQEIIELPLQVWEKVLDN